MNIVRVAGAIASATGITLYLEDGAEMSLRNDSWKTKAILEEVLPSLGKAQVKEIDIDRFSVEMRIEDKTAGVIRFIKKTMEQLTEMLADLEGNQKVPQTASSSASETAPKEELVAVVKTATGDVEIPGISKMEKQLEHAAFTGNTKGLQKFMERIAAVIKNRGHTVQELLNFMEKGDLPIADDGSIVAYKVLSSEGRKDGVFVDCHTRKVQQRLGSRVFMDPKLVDPSRSTECSQGLHIARRGYLRNFSGDIITMVKVAPEDVIAVPNDEPDKMRAAAYHIVNVLPHEVHAILRSNRPMTSNQIASKMLADVIVGNHVAVLEMVQIGGPEGTKVTVSGTKEKEKPAPKKFQNGEAKALDDAHKGLTPKEIREAARKAAAEQAEPVETKAQRDARKKREKRAAEKAAREAREDAIDSKVAAKALDGLNETNPATLDINRVIPGETKRERDARRKREKNAAAKAARQS